MIKDVIRSNFYGKLLIGKLHQVEGVLLPKIVPDKVAVKRHYKKETGKELNLANPLTFSEKMCWYKLYGRKPLMIKCADKVAVRKYVSDQGLDYTLNELYGIYSSVDEININKLPESFVLKAAHGSHMNIIVKNKEKENWKRNKALLNSWLKQNIYWSGREWVYRDIPHRIIAEKFLEDESGELRDYKFFTFNGIPRFVQVDTGRYAGNHVRNFYDLSWNLLDISDDVGYNPKAAVEKPDTFDEMIEIATLLSQPFQQVRVDLYEVNKKVVFGEMTYFHNGGVSKIKSNKWELIIGEMWELEE